MFYPYVEDRRDGLVVKRVQTVPYPAKVVGKPYKRFEYDEEDDVNIKTIIGRVKQRERWAIALEKQKRRNQELIH